MKPLDVTDATFEAEVLKCETPVVVDFWAPWCGPCRMQAPVLDKVAEKADGRIKFAKLNTDENLKVAQSCGILAIPTLVVFRSGQEVERSVGFHSEQDLETLLAQHLAAGSKE